MKGLVGMSLKKKFNGKSRKGKAGGKHKATDHKSKKHKDKKRIASALFVLTMMGSGQPFGPGPVTKSAVNIYGDEPQPVDLSKKHRHPKHYHKGEHNGPPRP